MCRLSVMGFNVLNHDTDAALLSDIYSALKSEPFNQFQLMWQARTVQVQAGIGSQRDTGGRQCIALALSCSCMPAPPPAARGVRAAQRRLDVPPECPSGGPRELGCLRGVRQDHTDTGHARRKSDRQGQGRRWHLEQRRQDRVHCRVQVGSPWPAMARQISGCQDAAAFLLPLRLMDQEVAADAVASAAAGGQLRVTQALCMRIAQCIRCTSRESKRPP